MEGTIGRNVVAWPNGREVHTTDDATLRPGDNARNVTVRCGRKFKTVWVAKAVELATGIKDGTYTMCVRCGKES